MAIDKFLQSFGRRTARDLPNLILQIRQMEQDKEYNDALLELKRAQSIQNIPGLGTPGMAPTTAPVPMWANNRLVQGRQVSTPDYQTYQMPSPSMIPEPYNLGAEPTGVTMAPPPEVDYGKLLKQLEYEMALQGRDKYGNLKTGEKEKPDETEQGIDWPDFAEKLGLKRAGQQTEDETYIPVNEVMAAVDSVMHPTGYGMPAGGGRLAPPAPMRLNVGQSIFTPGGRAEQTKEKPTGVTFGGASSYEEFLEWYNSDEGKAHPRRDEYLKQAKAVFGVK